MGALNTAQSENVTAGYGQKGGHYKRNRIKDFRNVNLGNEEEQKVMTELIKGFILDSTDVLVKEGFYKRLAMLDLYAEGLQVPVRQGNTDDVMTEFLRANINRGVIDRTRFKTQKDEHGKLIFIIDNKISQVWDAINSIFADAKRTTTVQNDDYEGNDGLEFGVGEALQREEEDKQWWENVRLPAIRQMNKYGLSWEYTTHNKNINPPNGEIRLDYAHPAEILLDAKATKQYFLNSRYIIRRERKTLEEVAEILKSIDLPEEWAETDTDPVEGYYQMKSPEKLSTNDLYQTLYWFEFRKIYTNKEQMLEYDINDSIHYDTIHYFRGLYLSNKGVVWFGENPYVDKDDFDNWQFTIVPYFDKNSDIRITPTSLLEKLISLQDVLTVLNSLTINRTIDMAKLRLFIKQKLEDKFGADLLKTFIKSGGYLPVEADDEANIRNMISTWELEGLPPEHYQFIQSVEQAIKDNSTTHESITGEMPIKGNISGVAITKLRQANQSKLSYKNTNINWTPTQTARLHYRIMAVEWKEEKFIKATNQDPDNPRYIPLNAIWNGMDYEKFLQKAYPDMDLMKALELFEKKNDVLVIYPRIDDRGMPPSEEYSKLNSVILINHLRDLDGQRYRLTIKVNFDFDAKTDKLEDLVFGTTLFESGKMQLKRLLDLKGGYFKHNADKIVAENEEADQIIAMAKAMAERGPEFIQANQQFMNQWDQSKQAADEDAKLKQQEETRKKRELIRSGMLN